MVQRRTSATRAVEAAKPEIATTAQYGQLTPREFNRGNVLRASAPARPLSLMRILYVTPAYKPADRMGGPIITVAATAEALAAKGHQVTVATTNANLDTDVDVPLDQPVGVDGVTVWYFARREPLRKWLPFIPYVSQSMGFAYAPAMKAVLRRLMADVDVVHTQMPFVYPTLVAARMALRLGKPLFYHQHGNFLPTRLERR